MLHALADHEDTQIGPMLRKWTRDRWRAAFGDAVPPESTTKFGDAIRPGKVSGGSR